MKDSVMRVDYYVHMAADRPGEGAKIHLMLKKGGVNLVAVHAFPVGGGKMQVDFVPENPARLKDVARREGLELEGPKTAFLIQGEDRMGALAEALERVAHAGINVTAVTGIGVGAARYGVLLWVAPRDVDAAARALGAVTLVLKH